MPAGRGLSNSLVAARFSPRGWLTDGGDIQLGADSVDALLLPSKRQLRPGPEPLPGSDPSSARRVYPSEAYPPLLSMPKDELVFAPPHPGRSAPQGAAPCT